MKDMPEHPEATDFFAKLAAAPLGDLSRQTGIPHNSLKRMLDDRARYVTRYLVVRDALDETK